ncbi:MFS general substrate transporter [Teratosphaeria nubilosa]|uniref:MFS general substrate transporter n=1 Tax=Teratosphaeria nubilosa TaxID=161662 RepID=A0A6G1LIF7_9PEZI|nr:MFS general substrate transporter [Teratosphaeria nubilosa]
MSQRLNIVDDDHQTAPSKLHPGPPGPPGGPPPDGGLTAWLQVLGGYFLFFNTWGLINAFGVFQTYYSNALLEDMSNSQVSWIGTFTAFLLCASPISWGPVFDIGSPRLLVIFGSLCVVFGLMMTSICTEYWEILLAQGVVCGVGGGCLFITATSILPSYFAKKRALAMGLAASGSSLGGIVYPIVFHSARPLIGFPWTVRIIGFIALLTLVVPCAFIEPRAKPPGKRKVFDLNIIKELPFEVFNLATFFGFVGQYIPYFYIVDYTLEHDMSITFYMLIVLNVGSIPGRIIPSVLADKYFPPIMVLAHSTTGLVVWSLLYGFCSGAFVSLQGAVVASMTTDMRTIGTRFGINMFAGALGILIGSPVGGAIFPHSWPGAQTFCAVMLLASTVSIIATWFVYKWDKARRSRRPKG